MESEEHSQRKAGSWLKVRTNDEQLFCCPCKVYYKWQLNSSHTYVTILVDSWVSMLQFAACLCQLYKKIAVVRNKLIFVFGNMFRKFTILTVWKGLHCLYKCESTVVTDIRLIKCLMLWPLFVVTALNTCISFKWTLLFGHSKNYSMSVQDSLLISISR